MIRPGALLLVLLLVACTRGGLVVEQDGEGALLTMPGASRGVWIGEENPHTGVGATWSFGDVRLCLTAPGLRPVVRSLEPASVVGQVRVAPIMVRNALRPPPRGSEPPEGYLERYRRRHIIGATRRIPPGLHEPSGWVVTTGCKDPWRPISEIVVTITKAGPEGGGIDGIVVTYGWEGRLHRYTIPVSFGICGTGRFELALGEPCGPG